MKSTPPLATPQISRAAAGVTATIVGGLLVLLLAAALRYGGAAHHGAWSDEGWNWWVVHDTSFDTIITRLTANHHPPAYFVSLGVWRTVAGESRLALRYPAILAGILCVALLFRAGVDVGGLFTGVAAAAIFAVFEQPVYYGQTIRHYGYLALGVCWSLLLFLRILRRKHPHFRLLAGYAFGVAFTLYSMYIGAFLIGIQGLVGLFMWRVSIREKARLIVAWMGAGLLLAPWLLYALPSQWSKVERGIITGYHNSFFTTPQNILTMTDLLLGGQAAIGLGLIALFVWRFVDPLFRRLQGRTDEHRVDHFTIFASSVGLFLLLLIVNLRFGLLAERTLFLIAPPVALLLGLGLRTLEARPRVMLLAALVIWVMLTPQNVVPSINADQAARIVADGYSPGDLVLLETGFDDAVFQYEMRLALENLDPNPINSLKVFRSFWEYDFPSDSDMLDALNLDLRTETRVWLVYWNVPQRLAALLTDKGFSQHGQWDILAGKNDPLYTQYPIITVTFFARPTPDDATHVSSFSPLIYGDLFELQDAQIAPVVKAGTSLHVDLWWLPLTAPERDYSVGVFLLDSDGVTRVESIGPDADNRVSTWQPGTPYLDRHMLELPDALSPGRYTVIANIYWYESPDAPLTVNDRPYAQIGQVEVR